MKTISAEAMAAIEAGEAIVTGAVEIYTPGRGPVGVPEATDVILTWQQSGDGFPLNPDLGGMNLKYYDDTFTLIGTDAATRINTPAGEWTLRTLNGTVPAGTSRLRVSMEIERRSGSEANQSFDDISLTIGGSSVPLTNPDAELGTMAGWTAEFGEFNAVTTASYIGFPSEGTYFFTGGNNNINSYYQDVFLSEVLPVEPGVVEAVLRVWGGHGPIELDGATYLGVGDRGLAQQTGGAVGGIAQGLELILSGIEPSLIELLDDVDEIKGGAVILRRLIFASDGKTLLDYDIWERGRVDTVSTVEKIGGEAAIRVGVESAARGLGRAGARMRSDTDQRLINPNDGYFRFTSYAGEKMLYWGGKKPSRVGGSTYIGSPASGGV